jgi:phosphoglucosamine mutase
VRVAQRYDVKSNAAVKAAVQSVEAALGDRGRVVLRPSGTEPVIRVMVEGEDDVLVEAHARRLAEVVRANGPAPG